MGGGLKHPVHVSLLGSPGLRPVCAEAEGSLMEEDRVKVRHRGQHVPVLGQMAPGLGTPGLQELVRPKLPEILLVSVSLAPGEDVLGVVHIIVWSGSQHFPEKQNFILGLSFIDVLTIPLIIFHGNSEGILYVTWQAVVVVVIEGEDKTSNDQGDYHTDAMNISLEISSYA